MTGQYHSHLVEQPGALYPCLAPFGYRGQERSQTSTHIGQGVGDVYGALVGDFPS